VAAVQTVYNILDPGEIPVLRRLGQFVRNSAHFMKISVIEPAENPAQ
jgi:hypothetical protein